ncbi:glycosyltransferase [Clostridium perfringens]|uniref:glycosyltransferase n=1 Tax=Clostridium perfringens TaxID=1502 RepID=UPI0024BC5E19|nr:glycosyltransferase [Clostridium perfringens]
MIEKVCCIIVSYNIGKKIEQCVLSIINQVGKVIIVDNGSNEETLKSLNYLLKKYNVDLILNKENKGIATALNQGVSYAIKNNYDWILTLDNDSKATANMVNIMLKTYFSLPYAIKKDIAGMFPCYLEEKIEDFGCIEASDNLFEYNYIITDMTSGNLIKAETFKKVGFFNEDLFIDYVDHEYCYRVNERGLKFIKVKNAILLHSLGNTKQKKFLNKKIRYTNHSYVRRYYITRNRFYTWKRFSSFKKEIRFDKLCFLKENIKILIFEDDKIKKVKMSLKGYKDFKKNKFGKIED